jgi:DNA-binding IclR family transcriptional regulator
MPYETARRAVLRLEQRGLVRKDREGLTLPLEVINRPEVVAGILHLVTLTETFLADLARAGIAYRPSPAPG